MYKIKNHISFVFLALLIVLSGCEKNGSADAPIIFAMDGVGIEASTKAALTSETIAGRSLYVYSTRTASGSATSIFSGSRVTRNANGFWYPDVNTNWASGSYTFRGLISSADFSTPIPTSSSYSASGPATPGIEVYNSGLSIWVNQPKNYDKRDTTMVDYLLSKTSSVSDGTARPIVELQMEHSLPSVEIYVIKAEAMYEAFLETITLSGIRSSARLTCTTVEDYGSTSLNTWRTDATLGGYDASYTLSGVNPKTDKANAIEIADEADSTSAKMRIMTVPQPLESSARLTVKYWINERTASPSDTNNYVSYSESFDLYNYDLRTWLTGHRIIYTLKVDSGIHLVGTIVPWKEVDFIEGTILPDIPNT